MRGYDRDEYEDLDEYEEEYEDEGEEEGEEEEEEEEVRQPTQEELEYLELRQRLKESIRKQMKKESGSTNTNTREKKNKMPYDNYGSFFGPSQPVIAQRVIQESKSLLENPHLAAKVSTSNNGNTKGLTSTHSSTHLAPKPRSNDHPPKVANGLKSKTKVQMLKNTRDYSFLLSDDAELPAPTKDPPPRNVSHPRAEVQPAQVPPKSKQLTGNNGRVLNGRHERKPGSTSSQMQPKAPPQKFASARKPNLASSDSRKQLGSSNGNGSGSERPPGPKGLPPKTITSIQEKKVVVPGAKSSVHGSQKPLYSKSQSSVPKQHLGQKKESQESSKGKMMPKQPVVSSKPQIKPPLVKNSARAPLQVNRPKKRPVRQYSDDDVDDDGGAISMIRNMFGYNPHKYRDDDDDSDMEANFDDILKEEKRSALIARKEDEEELRKIEEEERRERLRKEAKKRKLSR